MYQSYWLRCTTTSVRSSRLQAGDLGDVIEVSIVAVHFGDPLTLHLSPDQGILDIYGVGGVEVKCPKVRVAVSQSKPWEGQEGIKQGPDLLPGEMVKLL